MYQKKKQNILQHKFFQMLCRELKQYENRGIPLYFGGERTDAADIAKQCAIFHLGEYIGQTRRDQYGTVREIWFVRADSQSFEKNGRWKGDLERMKTKGGNGLTQKQNREEGTSMQYGPAASL